MRARIKQNYSSGFSLIELLLVITILGMLAAMIVPGVNMLDNHTRAKMTRETFTNIRLAILGAPNRYDQNGNPVLGGYVGDVGFLPKLYKREWDTTRDRWKTFTWYAGKSEECKVPYSTVTAEAEEQDALGNVVTNAYVVNAQPAALWNQNIADSTKNLQRTYLTPPVDPMPEDSVWDYDPSAPAGSGAEEENRWFLMRECEGSLSDGWAKNILIYTKEILTGSSTPKDLYFISAGPDGAIDYSDPMNLSLSDNSDNLIMSIVESDWNINSHKILATRSKLQKIKEAIIGTNNLVIDGQQQPYGFIADIGNPEPLTGDYVKKDGEVYRCITSHRINAMFDIGHGWEKMVGWNSGKFPEWQQNIRYYQSAPHLLAVRGELVKHGGKIYQATEDNHSWEPGTNSPWEEVLFHEVDHSLIGEYVNSNSRPYRALPSRDVNDFPVGWRAPYLDGDLKLPLVDSWNSPIQIELDEERNIILRSSGPSGQLLEDDGVNDDIQMKIYRGQYETAVEFQINGTDHYDIYRPKNGSMTPLLVNINGTHNKSYVSHGLIGTSLHGATPSSIGIAGTVHSHSSHTKITIP